MIKLISAMLAVTGGLFVLALTHYYNDDSVTTGYVMGFIVFSIVFSAGFLAAYKK